MKIDFNDYGNKTIMEMETKYDDKKLKVVISPVIASKLCNLGYPIVKLKPKRGLIFDNHDCNTIFLFEETEEFLRDFNILLEENKNKNRSKYDG